MDKHFVLGVLFVVVLSFCAGAIVMRYAMVEPVKPEIKRTIDREYRHLPRPRLA